MPRLLALDQWLGKASAIWGRGTRRMRPTPFDPATTLDLPPMFASRALASLHPCDGLHERQRTLGGQRVWRGRVQRQPGPAPCFGFDYCPGRERHLRARDGSDALISSERQGAANSCVWPPWAPGSLRQILREKHDNRLTDLKPGASCQEVDGEAPIHF